VVTDEEATEVVTGCEVVVMAEGEVVGAEATGGAEVVVLGWMTDEGEEEADVWAPIPLDDPGSAAAPMTAGMPP